jgi:hypothetical protein
MTTNTTVSLEDITILRRIKKHVASCDHCREALTKEEDGSSEPDQTIQTEDRIHHQSQWRQKLT